LKHYTRKDFAAVAKSLRCNLGTFLPSFFKWLLELRPKEPMLLDEFWELDLHLDCLALIGWLMMTAGCFGVGSMAS
jgi:hypothetical protein